MPDARPRRGGPVETAEAAGTGRARTGRRDGGAGPTGGRRPPGHRRVRPEVYRRRRRFVVLVLGIVVALLIGAVVWYQSQMGGLGGAATVVTVPAGASMGAVTASLVRAQVIDSSLAFRVYLIIHGTPTVLPGRYLMHRDDSFGDVRARLAAGPDVFAVTVLPGYTIGEVATQVDQVSGHDGAHFLSLAPDRCRCARPTSRRGRRTSTAWWARAPTWCSPGESDQTLLEAMVQRFDTLAGSVGLSTGAAALGVTPYQAITVASIVQKEGVYPRTWARWPASSTTAWRAAPRCRWTRRCCTPSTATGAR